MPNAEVPSYMKFVIDYIIEARQEIKLANIRNSELLEEVIKLRKENAELKSKLVLCWNLELVLRLPLLFRSLLLLF